MTVESSANEAAEFCGCGASIKVPYDLHTTHVLNAFRTNHRCLPVTIEDDSAVETAPEPAGGGNVEPPAESGSEDPRQVAVAGIFMNTPSGRTIGFT